MFSLTRSFCAGPEIRRLREKFVGGLAIPENVERKFAVCGRWPALHGHGMRGSIHRREFGSDIFGDVRNILLVLLHCTIAGQHDGETDERHRAAAELAGR